MKFRTGDLYTGEWRNGMMNREGTTGMVYPNGEKIHGQWVNDRRNGLGIHFRESCRYEPRPREAGRGEAKPAERAASCERSGSDTRIAQPLPEAVVWSGGGSGSQPNTLFGRSRLEGRCARARPRAQGDWRENRRHGLGLLVGSNGNSYQGEWRKDRPGIPGSTGAGW